MNGLMSRGHLTELLLDCFEVLIFILLGCHQLLLDLSLLLGPMFLKLFLKLFESFLLGLIAILFINEDFCFGCMEGEVLLSHPSIWRLLRSPSIRLCWWVPAKEMMWLRVASLSSFDEARLQSINKIIASWQRWPSKKDLSRADRRRGASIDGKQSIKIIVYYSEGKHTQLSLFLPQRTPPGFNLPTHQSLPPLRQFISGHSQSGSVASVQFIQSREGGLIVISLFLLFQFLDGFGFVLAVWLFGEVLSAGRIQLLIFGRCLFLLLSRDANFRLSSARFAFQIQLQFISHRQLLTLRKDLNNRLAAVRGFLRDGGCGKGGLEERMSVWGELEGCGAFVQGYCECLENIVLLECPLRHVVLEHDLVVAGGLLKQLQKTHLYQFLKFIIQAHSQHPFILHQSPGRDRTPSLPSFPDRWHPIPHSRPSLGSGGASFRIKWLLMRMEAGLPKIACVQVLQRKGCCMAGSSSPLRKPHDLHKYIQQAQKSCNGMRNATLSPLAFPLPFHHFLAAAVSFWLMDEYPLNNVLPLILKSDQQSRSLSQIVTLSLPYPQSSTKAKNFSFRPEKQSPE